MRAFWTTKSDDLKQYCFRGQTHLYRLRIVMNTSKQAWDSLLVPKMTPTTNEKLNIFRKVDNKNFCRAQNFTMGEAVGKRLLRKRNQQIVRSRKQ